MLEHMLRIFRTEYKKSENISEQIEKETEFYRKLHEKARISGRNGASMRRRSLNITEKAYIQYARDITG